MQSTHQGGDGTGGDGVPESAGITEIPSENRHFQTR
jgi:hypothetical protein